MDKQELESQLQSALFAAQMAAYMLDTNFGTDYLKRLDLTIDAAPLAAMSVDSTNGLAVIAAVEKVRAEAAAGTEDDRLFAADLPTHYYIQDAIDVVGDPALKFRISANCSNARFRLAMTGGGEFARRSKWYAYPLDRDPTGMRLWKLGGEDHPIPNAAALAGDLTTADGRVLWEGLHLKDMEAWARQQWKEFLDILAARRGNAQLPGQR